MDGESWDQSHSLTAHKSESKVLVGQKRGFTEVEETSDSSQKRKKMRDLESVFRSEASSSLYAFANSVMKFNGLNYDDWSEQIRFTLGIMSLDLAIQMDEKPPAITDKSSDAEKSLYEAWERSNRLSLNLMRMTMAESIKPSMPKTENAKEFMQQIKECSQSDLADKSIVGSLMSQLTTKKFDWSQPIHDHVTHMSNLAAKLKSMGMDINDTFLVQFIMNSLPPEFGQFQVNYNTIKDKWNFQELKAMLVQEEGRLKKMKDQAVHFVSHDGASSSKAKPGKKGKNKDRTFVKGPEGKIRKEKKCFFCKKSGHFKKDCPKRKAWFEKKAQAVRELDLNINVSSVNCLVGNDNPACVHESHNLPTSGKAKAYDLDLNAEDISSSVNDPFFPYKNSEHSKLRDGFGCGSSVGPLDEKDSLRVWKGLKQNNYMSTLYGFAPKSIPNPRGRKKVNNNEVMKKKIELAKKEQVDRFARVAAPSGLLNGLNPGIINHVRNSKQVHSIIEALVRSEKNENRVSASNKCSQDVNSSGVNTSGLCRGDGLVGRRPMTDYGLFSKMGSGNMSNMPSQCDVGNEDDKLALKLSSSATVASENTSCLSNDESGNLRSVNSLSVKAANVASQWLDLLNQDIKGRLAALRRSKKRVGAVITTELPLLISREFSTNPGKDACDTKGSTFSHFDQAAADAHSVKWSSLFEQMEKTLSEEESQLESWLNQVKEMQLHCDKGLYKNSLYNFSQPTDVRAGNDGRSVAADQLEKDLAVRAAAASIYSTCNFLLSMENC